MVRVQYSQSYEAKRSRMRRLPSLAKKSMRAEIRKDAYGVIEEFQKGIARANFNLAPLKDETAEKKAKKGYSKPRTPLYGLGEGGKNTYINMMGVEREGNSYRVRPRNAQHHESGLPLRAMFVIHEYGTTIRRGEGFIRIPPRPAFFMAYRRYLGKKQRQEPAAEVRNRMVEFINSGREMSEQVREYRRLPSDVRDRDV